MLLQAVIRCVEAPIVLIRARGVQGGAEREQTLAQGREIITALGRHKVDPRFIRINPGKKSNYHYVLWYEEERTILINHEEYDYHWPHIAAKELPRWVYFSSISKNAMDYHDDIADWLDENPTVHLAFQPGTFQMRAGVKRMKRMYQNASILLLNREEAAYVGGGDSTVKDLRTIDCSIGNINGCYSTINNFA